jgi:hypothetical protein
MLRVILVLGTIGLLIYCLIDLWQTRAAEAETLPRPAWVAIVVLLPLIGPIGWLVFGRPARDEIPLRHPADRH